MINGARLPLPAAGVDPKVSCAVTISNSGNVGLGSFTLVASATTYGLTCADNTVLAAGATRECTLTRSVNQVMGGVDSHGHICHNRSYAHKLSVDC